LSRDDRGSRIRQGAGAFVALLLIVCSSGCGYALAGRGSFLPEYIRTIGIPPIENATSFLRVEQVLTEKIRNEFINRGKYTIIPAAGGAQAVLTGAITGFTAQPVGFTEQQLASRYLIAMTLRVEFTDATTNEVLWSNNALTFREEYDLRTRSNTALEGAGFLEQEGPAFDRISGDVARAVVSAILEAF
jgi:hypothetical protein